MTSTYHPNGSIDPNDTTKPRTGAASDPGVADQVRERLAEHSEALRERGAEMRDQLGGTAQQLGETAQQATEEGARFVRENPGLALAGALGVGLLIGLSVRGRS
ncbi:DUF883 family protein [Tropicimonas sediminicola]|uniref:Membrane-anchored ribosome-binding protein, inhibits growth in stationary phase, ElaB/YqjD/DUF883 family n=1 Tax=Tropicimonas sediminicola TaxID=1031541 RepID=A0A239KZ00_9RHOB|nr:hypothetical protein [Tropicimonas sediminicola]SNT23260.1 hypothetical protein SAMN05421757_108133 [Tropicimonas sediminicola]